MNKQVEIVLRILAVIPLIIVGVWYVIIVTTEYIIGRDIRNPFYKE